ncbi:uncharacterized protein LOC6562899 [Drosophila grimshawi]|uniref:GH10357 n=1 Tax=Drosophila grimshawi TaxID=7222 RepID=B4JA31_DROGR|nr:uncharacterized protein LOC6562899 [Drosophila grimshawi]EDW03705.1 GH10357 [Drosophila grimshawi]
MENKSSVSALQEFCSQAKTGNPFYDYIDGEEGGYICKVVLMDVEAYGNGRSKRDAKHLAATNIMRKLPNLAGSGLAAGSDADGSDNFNVNKKAEELTNMNRDMLKELRDYCVRQDMPLPTIEIVQQSGTPSAPEFVACCSVASIKRYGKSDKKKDARQRAAIEMLYVISEDANRANAGNQLVDPKMKNASDLEDTLEDAESERRRKFKTFRELTDAGDDDNLAIKICDRHKYFKTYYSHLKEAAFEAINSNEYVSSKAQSMAILDALKLTSRTTRLESESLEPVLMIELICDYDACFVGLESEIYQQIIDYFRIMLF